VGRLGDRYLERWRKVNESEEAKELREDNSDVYEEVAGFLDDQLALGNIDRQTVINICYGLLIHHTARIGRCPACEMFEASELIHKDIGCPEVH
jgi:hypothetical protein